MQKLLSVLFLSITLLVFASCSDNDEPEVPEVPQTAQKTIFVFMPYTGDNGNLYDYFINNLNDMEKAINERGGLGDTHLIAYISKNANTSHLIDFKYKKGSCVRDTVKTYSTADYLTVNGMSSIFSDMKQYAPANNYALIVGSHGEGWLPKDGTARTRWFGGAKYKIETTDLAQSIKNAGIKMQFIMFDDCYMSCIEVAYDLREAADWLIASTSEMMDYGMPYHNILKYLLAETPDYASMCNEFIKFYKSYRMPYGTLGVTNLAYVDEMASLMKGINATHTFNIDDIDNIQDLDSKHFTPTVYFDFGSYAHVLCGNDNETKAQYDKLMQLLVPYKCATEYIYSYSGRAELEVKEYSGLTISDPSININVVDTKEQTAWWKATH